MKRKRKIPTFYWEYTGHKPPEIDIEKFRLEVGGMVQQAVSLRIDELSEWFPFCSQRRRFYCVNGWSLEEDWGGYRLHDVLGSVGPEAKYLRATSIGGYEDTTAIEDLLRGDAMLVTHMANRPLPPKRGFPIRLMLFDMYQFKGVKSVTSLEVTDEYRPGTWQSVGYRDATIQPYPHLDITSGDRVTPPSALTEEEKGDAEQ